MRSPGKHPGAICETGYRITDGFAERLAGEICGYLYVLTGLPTSGNSRYTHWSHSLFSEKLLHEFAEASHPKVCRRHLQNRR